MAHLPEWNSHCRYAFIVQHFFNSVIALMKGSFKQFLVLKKKKVCFTHSFSSNYYFFGLGASKCILNGIKFKIPHNYVQNKWKVWSEGWCSPRISTQPTALHHCAWSLITRVPLWGPLGGPLCRWPCYHRWIPWGMCQEALDLERSNGEERTESKCRKDKDHDLRYGTGPPAELRRVSMRCLSHWSGQQQHLLQWLQALGAQEMQWAHALEKGPWL